MPQTLRPNLIILEIRKLGLYWHTTSLKCILVPISHLDAGETSNFTYKGVSQHRDVSIQWTFGDLSPKAVDLVAFL